MTDLEILQKAIKKAIEKGDFASLENNSSLLLATYPILIFSHKFAKAFWGEERTEYIYNSFNDFIQHLNISKFSLSREYFGIGGSGEECIIGEFNNIKKFINDKMFYKINSLFGDLILKDFNEHSYSGKVINDVNEALTSYFVSYGTPGTPGADVLVKLDENNYKKYLPQDTLIYHLGWKYHLQQMVLEEEPLKYLEKFLGGENE